MTPQAFETTVCNCTEPTKIGILQFSDANCLPEINDEIANTVEYSIFSMKRAALKFPGYICAKWKNLRHITMNFFGQLVIVPEKISIDTSPNECNDMVHNKQCNGNLMTKVDNKFIFDRDPENGGYWLQTITTEKINCVLEIIELYQDDSGANFSTPLGMASADTGYLAHNHLTVVWDKTYTQIFPLTARRVESGIGKLIKKIGQNLNFRLQDNVQQLEFHLTFQPRCNDFSIDCQKKESAFDIIGQPHLFLKTSTIINTFPEETLSESTPSIDKIANFQATLQYFRDTVTDHENELARIIQILQCDTRRATHERALATAQYNGWLAAFQLNLPACTKLQAFGRTAVVVSCKPLNVTFETVMTSCGPQPKFQNSTINLDGWELVNYSPCYWAHGFVNFNDKPYAYRNNTWQAIEASIILPEQSLAHSFRYEDVKFLDYNHQSNPAYRDSILDHMNIMADIAAAMNEHSSDGFVNNHLFRDTPSVAKILVTSSVIGSYTTWWDTLTMYFYIALICIFCLVILRICYCCGFFGLIWKLCCRPAKHTRTAYQEPNVRFLA